MDEVLQRYLEELNPYMAITLCKRLDGWCGNKPVDYTVSLLGSAVCFVSIPFQMATGGKPPASLNRLVARMPHYAGMDVSEAVARFHGDLVATGLMQATKKKILV